MNNNRGNNRRRGRGNNRAQGGQQLNRIDSRARGNAPQLLDKYKKMAHDAHLNGDRVQEEYYLQFADHYFRVIADTRARQEEQRQRNTPDRWQDQDSDEDNDEGEPGGESGRRDNRRNDRRERDDTRAEQGQIASEGEPIDGEGENPFVREGRQTRAPRARGERRPRREQAEPQQGDAAEDASEEESSGLDPSSLPPSLGAKPADEGPAEAPAPKRRGRPRKTPPADTAAETVNG